MYYIFAGKCQLRFIQMFSRTFYRLRPVARLINNPIKPLPAAPNEVPIKDILRTHETNLIPIRHYAKSKDKKKEKTKKGVKVEINEAQMREVINFDALNDQMQRAVDAMRDEFIKNLSLRSSTGAIESLKVTLDGQEHELQELGQIIRKNPKTIVVNMIAFPQTIPDVLKAIQKSGMNLNPQQDGTTLFIPVPKVTKEHRENLAKGAKALFVKCRDSIRDVQTGTIKKLKKQSDISEDVVHSVQNQIVLVADKYIGEAEKMLTTKQAELVGSES